MKGRRIDRLLHDDNVRYAEMIIDDAAALADVLDYDILACNASNAIAHVSDLVDSINQAEVAVDVMRRSSSDTSDDERFTQMNKRLNALRESVASASEEFKKHCVLPKRR